jgi:hypothetical protein
LKRGLAQHLAHAYGTIKAHARLESRARWARWCWSLEGLRRNESNQPETIA